VWNGVWFMCFEACYSVVFDKGMDDFGFGARCIGNAGPKREGRLVGVFLFGIPESELRL
ncbi:MAG: hypothetical protein ACI8S6_002324, partial [Myxococcota bacterium]